MSTGNSLAYRPTEQELMYSRQAEYNLRSKENEICRKMFENLNPLDVPLDQKFWFLVEDNADAGKFEADRNILFGNNSLFASFVSENNRETSGIIPLMTAFRDCYREFLSLIEQKSLKKTDDVKSLDERLQICGKKLRLLMYGDKTQNTTAFKIGAKRFLHGDHLHETCLLL